MFSRSKGLGILNYLKTLFQNPLERESLTYKEIGRGAVFYPRDYRNPSPGDAPFYCNPLVNPFKQEGIAKFRYYNRRQVLFDESGGKEARSVTGSPGNYETYLSGEQPKSFNLSTFNAKEKIKHHRANEVLPNTRRIEWAPTSDYL